MKIGIAQINPTVGDIKTNVSKILEFAQKAHKQGADLVAFPELSITGYPPKDLLLKESFVQANLDALEFLAAELKSIPAIVGFVDKNKGPGRPLHNAAALLKGGRVESIQHKTLLPTYDVFDEDRYFEPAQKHEPMKLGDFTIGATICEDIWNDAELLPRKRYQIDPVERVLQGASSVMLNISASPYSLGKEKVRLDLVRNAAMKAGMPAIYVNQVGGNDELVFDGRSIVVNAKGQLIARAASFEEDLLIVNPFDGHQEIEDEPDHAIENVHKALLLGTRDYIRKCGFGKVVVGLSGGIDSAVVCAIAVQALGAENVLGVSMPSPYSSQGSLTDARELAENLGIEYKVVPIASAMETMDKLMDPVFAGLQRDVTEENIQARLRGMILMAISNKLGHLVLTTGNKSELAVGYCTLYGDMCGGLAIISDLPKMMVYELARHINLSASKVLIPESSIEKPPSAELRPGQLDQDSLPPYPVLDAILHYYVEEQRSVAEIVKRGFDRKVVMDVINRVDRNEYKRYQAAPGLKVTGRSFGVGWRMPIAQRFTESLDTAPMKLSERK